jgi:hypothetical protein
MSSPSWIFGNRSYADQYHSQALATSLHMGALKLGAFAVTPSCSIDRVFGELARGGIA